MRAVDRWVRAAFSGIFLALSFFRFESDSQPSHLPLTPAVSWQCHLDTQYQDKMKNDMKPWQITKVILESENPLARFDNRIGGTSTIAKRELLALLEFGEGLNFFRYRYMIFKSCKDKLGAASARTISISLRLPNVPIGEKMPESLATWFEFESLLAVIAALLDRLGNVLGWTYDGIVAGRLDANIKKLPTNSHLIGLLDKHLEWISYVADLRNTSMHRLLLSHDPGITAHQGELLLRLPDSKSIKNRGSVDPRQLTYVENRTIANTVEDWHNNLIPVVEAVFDDYFSKVGR